MEGLRFSETVYRQIVKTIGAHQPECGGIIGADASGVIDHYYFDLFGKTSPNGYAPDIQTVNRILAEEWMPKGILMVGIVHSHANGVNVPSCGDINYGMRILQALDTVDKFYLPIVTTDKAVEMSCFVIEQGEDGRFVCRSIDYDVIGR